MEIIVKKAGGVSKSTIKKKDRHLNLPRPELYFMGLFLLFHIESKRQLNGGLQSLTSWVLYVEMGRGLSNVRLLKVIHEMVFAIEICLYNGVYLIRLLACIYISFNLLFIRFSYNMRQLRQTNDIV